jgi:predicted nucleic acid-binding protein
MRLPRGWKTFLCDTNVLSDLARPRPDAGVIAWASTVNAITVSAVTVEEIHCGLAWKPNARVGSWFDTFFLDRCEVLPITWEIAARCGDLRGRLLARGAVRTQADMLIAATAQVHALTVVTRNVRDFVDCLVPILNPFSD